MEEWKTKIVPSNQIGAHLARYSLRLSLEGAIKVSGSPFPKIVTSQEEHDL